MTGSRILHGIKRIARYLGLTDRQVRHLIEQERLPTFKLGTNVCTTPALLDQFVRDLERASVDQWRSVATGGPTATDGSPVSSGNGSGNHHSQ